MVVVPNSQLLQYRPAEESDYQSMQYAAGFWNMIIKKDKAAIVNGDDGRLWVTNNGFVYYSGNLVSCRAWCRNFNIDYVANLFVKARGCSDEFNIQ